MFIFNCPKLFSRYISSDSMSVLHRARTIPATKTVGNNGRRIAGDAKPLLMVPPFSQQELHHNMPQDFGSQQKGSKLPIHNPCWSNIWSQTCPLAIQRSQIIVMSTSLMIFLSLHIFAACCHRFTWDLPPTNTLAEGRFELRPEVRCFIIDLNGSTLSFFCHLSSEKKKTSKEKSSGNPNCCFTMWRKAQKSSSWPPPSDPLEEFCLYLRTWPDRSKHVPPFCWPVQKKHILFWTSQKLIKSFEPCHLCCVCFFGKKKRRSTTPAKPKKQRKSATACHLKSAEGRCRAGGGAQDLKPDVEKNGGKRMESNWNNLEQKYHGFVKLMVFFISFIMFHVFFSFFVCFVRWLGWTAWKRSDPAFPSTKPQGLNLPERGRKISSPIHECTNHTVIPRWKWEYDLARIMGIKPIAWYRQNIFSKASINSSVLYVLIFVFSDTQKGKISWFSEPRMCTIVQRIGSTRNSSWQGFNIFLGKLNQPKLTKKTVCFCVLTTLDALDDHIFARRLHGFSHCRGHCCELTPGEYASVHCNVSCGAISCFGYNKNIKNDGYKMEITPIETWLDT